MKFKTIWIIRPFSKRRHEWKGQPVREIHHHGTVIGPPIPEVKKGATNNAT